MTGDFAAGRSPAPGFRTGSPADDELGARLTEVLTVIYLLCNEGYLSTAGSGQSRDLVEDAEWLASLLHQRMPAEPEVMDCSR